MLFGRYEMSLCGFMLFAAQFSYEIYPDEISCFSGAVTSFAYEIFLACLALMRFLDEISCLLAAEYSF